MPRTPEHIYDEWLAARARGGQAAALEALIVRWQGRLLAHARRLTGSPEGATEALQETLVCIARQIRRLEDPATFRAWAFRIASRRSADWIRRRRRDRARVGSLGSEVEAPDAPPDGDEETAAVRAALSSLDAEDQAILAMRYHAEMSVVDIGVAMDLPVGTVKSRLHAARGRLRTILERANEGAMA
jgi:RNA polymerase sigma factor (sigma-70 family)